MKGEAEAGHESRPGAQALLRRVALAVSHGVADLFSWARDAITRGIIAARISADFITLAGPLLVSIVYFPAFWGSQPLCGLVMIVAGACDILDGAVARASGGSSPFGGFLDSVVDRYTDFAMMFGLLVYLDRHVDGPSRLLYLVLWAVSLVGTSTTAYVRARAETVIPSCSVGFMERPERTVTVIIGLLSWNVHITLWILAVMTNLISVQRILHARLAMRGEEPRGELWFWLYPRLTTPHFVLCATFILLLVFGHHLIPRP